MMMFKKVRLIVPHTLSFLNIANTCHIAPLPTILVLWHFRVHVHTMDHCNIASYIKLMIDYSFGILTCLGVPDIDLYNSHIWLGRHLDNTRLWSEYDIIEYVIVFKNFFNFFWSNTTVGFLTNKRNTYNLEVWFGLRQPCQWYLVCIRRKWVFNISLNFLKIWVWHNIVGHYDYTFIFNTNEIC